MLLPWFNISTVGILSADPVPPPDGGAIYNSDWALGGKMFFFITALNAFLFLFSSLVSEELDLPLMSSELISYTVEFS